MACSIINKVRMYHIMQDEFHLFKELDIKKCRALAYSNGGHLLACVDGNGPWCGGLEPATNDRAQSAEAVKKAYEAELAKLVTKRPPPEPSDSQDQKK